MWKQTSAWITVVFSIVAGLLLISTIVLTVLFGIERNKTEVKQDARGKLHSYRRIQSIFLMQTIILVNDNSDLCLTPYCIKAG
jgi:hypothetical protein